MKKVLFHKLNNKGDKLPTEFRIFKFGKNETSKGVFIYNQTSEDRIKEESKSWGNDLCLDYEHQQSNSNLVGPIPSGGWFNLDFRKDGLWAVNVRFTDEAKGLILSKKYRYTSPTFYTDNDNIILSLYNVSLVNIPATWKQTALIAASKLTQQRGLKLDNVDIKIEDPEILNAIEAAGITDVATWVIELIKGELAEEKQEVPVENKEEVVKTSKGEFLALISSQKLLKETQDELKKLHLEIENRDRKEVLTRLKNDGKITPAMDSFISKLAIKDLLEFEKCAPTQLNRTQVQVPEVKTFQGKNLEQLSKADVWTRIELQFQNPELFAEVEKFRNNK